ncbi:hypothetical protein BN77_p60001 [Rhizobium mesoamericanum STM3625]|uniref:Uncharacterized protein n=1 Tax=Rhizobium mesoamericanum STM3625 TaxID=1211777 RepID=K0PSV7_9HYPH|nr:hypothetical protein BN77_p60001 [Rhizobium mesoamericanum STM3625]
MLSHVAAIGDFLPDDTINTSVCAAPKSNMASVHYRNTRIMCCDLPRKEKQQTRRIWTCNTPIQPSSAETPSTVCE